LASKELSRFGISDPSLPPSLIDGQRFARPRALFNYTVWVDRLEREGWREAVAEGGGEGGGEGALSRKQQQLDR
jgi:hypothetical protein